MSRIRTLKPEICTSESLSKCSRDARLLFSWMLLFCDDGGVHTYSLYRLKTEIFPGDDDMPEAKIDELLHELEENNVIVFYEVNDKSYIRVVEFLRDQRIDQPTYRLPWENGKIPVAKKKEDMQKLLKDGRDLAKSSRKRKAVRNFLIQRDGHECSYCGSTTRTLTIDHIIPTSKGGTNDPENLCLACRKCNTLKGNKLVTPRRSLGEAKARDDQENKMNIQVTSVDNSEKLDKNDTKTDKIDQNLISGSLLTPGREGKGSIPVSVVNINHVDNSSIEDLLNNKKNQTDPKNKLAENKTNKRGRPKKPQKWNANNWEAIPDDIVAGFDVLYYNNWPPPLKGRVQGLCEYANMNSGKGATEDELKNMCAAIKAQKVEASLKVKDGFKTYFPRIATWIRNRGYEDEVDLSTPMKLKPKSSKFMENAMMAAQNGGN